MMQVLLDVGNVSVQIVIHADLNVSVFVNGGAVNCTFWLGKPEGKPDDVQIANITSIRDNHSSFCG